MSDVPRVSGSEIEDKQGKLAQLLAKRGGKFTAPKYYRTGGVRHLYRTDYGLNGEVPAVVKLERSSVDSPRAQRHLERGCTTESEIRHVIGLDNPGVTKMLDYFSPTEAAECGIDGAVIVEEFRPKAVSLEEWVHERGPLKGRQLKQFVRSYAETMRAVRKKEIIHRDHKSSNILLEEDRAGGIEVRVTDWANAAYAGEIRPSVFPTGGGHDAMHPRIMPIFAPSGQENLTRAYTDECEIYGIAHNIAFAALGRKIFDYDPDTGRAVEWNGGNSVLTDGKLDSKKHNAALRRATKDMPRSLRKVVRHAMALDDLDSFYSVDRFTANAIYAARDPNLKDISFSALKWAGRAAAIVLPISAALWAIGTHEPTKLGMPSLAYETAPWAADWGDRKNLLFVREKLADLPARGETLEKLSTTCVINNRHVAGLYKAYLEASHHLGQGWNPNPSDVQFQTWTSTTLPQERSFVTIESAIPGAIEYGITQAEIREGVIDLEDACTIARVGLKKLDQARWYSGKGRNFADYLTARDDKGNYVISPEDQRFLVTWLGYVREVEFTTHGSGTGFSPVGMNELITATQPAVKISDYWPAPRTQPPLDSIDFTKKQKEDN